MHHSSNGYARFSSEYHEKPRLNDARPMDSRGLPYYNGWSSKQSFFQQLATSAQVALMNVRQIVGHYWQVQASKSDMASAKPPSPRDPSTFSNTVFVLLCGLWYTTSALSSNTGKAIMTQFRYPITLTFFQFGFIAVCCLISMSPLVRFSKLRMPNKAIIQSTLPMGLFQVGGHMFSSMAISRIPVSTVHTIKALSPLFTVAAYALLFGVSYSSKTYVSLLPLTLGVMLACSFDVSASDFTGLLCAFGSALVFVSSNIFFKKIMPSGSNGHSTAHKLDKINLLLYSSGMAFLFMIPLWLYYDLPLLVSAQANPQHIAHPKQGHASPHSVAYYFFMNGTVHFAQNIIAFVILSSTSPVTYSIASLIKRVAVICIAIVWFNQNVHPVQAFGIVLTFTGLYMYNNAKGDVEKGEKKATRVQATRDMLLPTTKAESRLYSGVETPPNEYVPTYTQPDPYPSATGVPAGTAYTRPRGMSIHSSGSTVQDGSRHHAPPPLDGFRFPKQESFSGLSGEPIVRITPPLDPYPSPPPSLELDSPTSHTISLPETFLQAHAHEFQQAEPVLV